MAPPAVILVRPQLAENVGMAARAMANFGLGDLRLAAPRTSWPDPRGTAAAAGALERAGIGVRVFGTLAGAVGELQVVHALTARPRALARPALTPRDSALELAAAAGRGEASGLLFGPENAGLANKELDAAEAVVAIPAAGAFRSLNLAMAVLVMGYEWRLAEAGGAPAAEAGEPGPVAGREDLEFFLGRLVRMLAERGFFHPPAKAPRMERSVRAIFARNRLTGQELRTLHGIVSALASARPPGGGG